jgi:hypothetical protein
MTWAAAVISPMVSFDAQAGHERGGHHRRELAAHDGAHQVQHLVVEDLAVLDGAQRFPRGDGHGNLLRS